MCLRVNPCVLIKRKSLTNVSGLHEIYTIVFSFESNGIIFLLASSPSLGGSTRRVETSNAFGGRLLKLVFLYKSIAIGLTFGIFF